MIQNELDVIINSAAAVDFINTLTNAMRDNFHNTMRVFNFAKGCPNLQVFVQVSTAYVNSNRSGLIEEKLYDPSFNIEETLQYIHKLPEDELEKHTPELIKGYPNTYTYSKFLTEHKLKRDRGNMSLVIVRPTIIGASYQEPFPGWVDAVTALTGLYFYVGLGITKEIIAKPHTVLDVVAVDLCANMIIAAGAFQANKKTLAVMHSGSSHRNPVNLKRLLHLMVRYLTDHRTKGLANTKPKLDFYNSETTYNLAFFIKRKLPVMLMDFAGKFMQNEQMMDKAALYKKALGRATMLNNIFQHFTTTQWVFDTSSIDSLNKHFTKEDTELFPYDMGIVDWEKYSTYYLYGLWTYVGKEKLDPPFSTNYENIFQNKEYLQYAKKPFGDLQFISSLGNLVDNKDTELRLMKILENSEVQNSMKKYIDRKRKLLISRKAPVREDKLKEEAYEQAKKYAKRVECKMQKWIALSFALFTHKFLKKIFSKILVNPDEIEMIKQIKKNSKGPIIIIPNHRSYMDFLMISYMMFAYGFDAPYVAAAEDFLGIPLISKMFRGAGAFFIKRGSKSDPIYRAILREYVKHLLMEGNSLEFYIEGKRSRRGKLLKPKLGMLKIVLETYLEKRIPDVTIIPISISYDRILEAESFIQEFMGEGKQAESLGRVIKGFTTIFEKYGTAHVSFGKPIQISKIPELSKLVSPSITGSMNHDAKKELERVGIDILYRISEGRVVMSTEIVASLLMSRKTLSFSELIDDFEIIRKDLLSKKTQIVFLQI